MIDPVELSGGEKGGEVVEGQAWGEGETRDFDGLRYRRVGGQAVYAGLAD